MIGFDYTLIERAALYWGYRSPFDKDDLLGEFGLVAAICLKKFDESQNIKFSTYFSTACKNAVLKKYKKLNDTPRHVECSDEINYTVDYDLAILLNKCLDCFSDPLNRWLLEQFFNPCDKVNNVIGALKVRAGYSRGKGMFYESQVIKACSLVADKSLENVQKRVKKIKKELAFFLNYK